MAYEKVISEYLNFLFEIFALIIDGAQICNFLRIFSIRIKSIFWDLNKTRFRKLWSEITKKFETPSTKFEIHPNFLTLAGTAINWQVPDCLTPNIAAQPV